MEAKRTIVKVQGMTCRHCEKTIEGALSAVDGVIKVKADYVKQVVYVVYQPELFHENQLPTLIDTAGYQVKNEQDSAKIKLIKSAMVLAMIILAYLLLARLGVFSFVPTVQAGSSLIMIFLVGLMTSVHCLAMCGGIGLAAGSTRTDRKENQGRHRQNVDGSDSGTVVQTSRSGAAKSAVQYNAGRILSYTLTGALAGLLGQVIAISDTGRNVIMLLAGFFMIVMGLNLLGLAPWARKIKLPLPRSLKNVTLKSSKNTLFWVGLLNGLMPCGPLQMMQLYALGTGNVLLGAMSMLVFALGTTPLMFGISFFAGLIRGRQSQIIRIVSASLVLLLGMQMIGRVVDLPMLMQARQANRQIQAADGTVAQLENEYQVVETRFLNGRYQPIVVQAGVPVRWTISAQEGDLNGCNYSILINEYGIAQDLDFGDTVIEFLPEEPGVVRYTCWMNMISSHITVVEDLP